MKKFRASDTSMRYSTAVITVPVAFEGSMLDADHA
jgi:hypothetical protein